MTTVAFVYALTTKTCLPNSDHDLGGWTYDRLYLSSSISGLVVRNNKMIEPQKSSQSNISTIIYKIRLPLLTIYWFDRLHTRTIHSFYRNGVTNSGCCWFCFGSCGLATYSRRSVSWTMSRKFWSVFCNMCVSMYRAGPRSLVPAPMNRVTTRGKRNRIDMVMRQALLPPPPPPIDDVVASSLLSLRTGRNSTRPSFSNPVILFHSMIPLSRSWSVEMASHEYRSPRYDMVHRVVVVVVEVVVKGGITSVGGGASFFCTSSFKYFTDRNHGEKDGCRDKSEKASYAICFGNGNSILADANNHEDRFFFSWWRCWRLLQESCSGGWKLSWWWWWCSLSADTAASSWWFCDRNVVVLHGRLLQRNGWFLIAFGSLCTSCCRCCGRWLGM